MNQKHTSVTEKHSVVLNINCSIELFKTVAIGDLGHDSEGVVLWKSKVDYLCGLDEGTCQNKLGLVCGLKHNRLLVL